jgi:hypothetical protein
MKPVTLMDILTSSGKYPEREKSEECDGYVHLNAYELAARVSELLVSLGITSVKVSSGFRTAAANAAAKGSARSAHMTGEAVDLEDPNGAICNAIMADPFILSRTGLYMESPQHTPTWCHLQTRPTKNRIFKP